MSRHKNKLTAITVRNAKKPGRIPDGAGLFLQVEEAKGGGHRQFWVFRFRAPGGRKREMGLGSTDLIDLTKARQRAEAARKLVADGVDPIEHRKAEKHRLAEAASNLVTFRDAAIRFIDTNKAGWKNAKHADQWLSTLEAYVFPVFGDRPVDSIDVKMVLKVIEPIWLEKTETASRVRGRIERILDWARTRELRSGDNPARWRGHIAHILPSRSKTQKVKHFPALPYADMPAFYAELVERRGMSPIALRFAILTVGRTQEILGTPWKEIDLTKAIWTIPADRMKVPRDHRVPLSPAAVSLLEGLRLDRGADDWVFPGQNPGQHHTTLEYGLKEMGWTDNEGRPITVHGTCRSTFRDWVSEETDFPREVSEAAIAHVIGDATERAYRRGDLFEKRRLLMNEWATYCTSMLLKVEGPQRGI